MKGFMKLRLFLAIGSACFLQCSGLHAQTKPTSAPAAASPVGGENVTVAASTAPGGLRGIPVGRGGVTATTPTTAAPGYYSSSRDSIPPVIIRFGDDNEKVTANLEEDLSIMTHLISRTLERAASDDKVVSKLGVPMLLTGSGKSVRAMFVEGMGALFMIKVDFPVMGPSTEPTKESEKEGNDSEWSAARRELFGAPDAWSRTYQAEPKYNAEEVELLKTQLINALKNAANIRGLGSSESVTIAVFGHPAPTRAKDSLPGRRAGANHAAATDQAVNAVGQYPRALNQYSVTTSADTGRGTVLTLRATKSDITAFASGKLDPDAFKAKVRTASYVGSGYGVTSVNSWATSGSYFGNLQAR